MTDWAVYFSKMREESTGARAIPPVVVTIVEREQVKDATGLGTSIRTCFNLVTEAAWPRVELWTSLAHYSDEYRLNDSKKKPGIEAPEFRKGELLKPAHEVRYWTLLAMHPDFKLAMLVQWEEGVTAKGGRSFGFISAQCHDPIGMPTELFVDYEPSGNDLKQVKDEPGWAHESRVQRMRYEAERRDRQYNLGKSWLNHQPLFKKAGEFEAWRAEAIAMTTQKEAA